jgi:hypothetical protein
LEYFWLKSGWLIPKFCLKLYSFRTLMLFTYHTWYYLYSQQNTTPLSTDLEIFYSLLINASSLYFCQPWILFRKWTISHKTHTFNYITAQHCSVPQAHSTEKSHSQDHSTQT